MATTVERQFDSCQIQLSLRDAKGKFTVLKVWKGPIDYKGTPAKQEAIFISVFFTSIFKQYGVRGAHITYPSSGDIHQTFDYADGKLMHVFPNKISIQLPRDLESVNFPDKESLGLLTHLSPRGKYPSFDQLSNNACIQLFGLGIPVPLTVRGHPVEDAGENADEECIDVSQLSGTLNVSPYVLGERTGLEALRDTHTVSTRSVGARAPFLGIQVSLH